MLPKVLVDTCGWIALIDAEINVDYAFAEIFGKYEFIVINPVWEELEIFQKNNTKNILLDMLRKKSSDIYEDELIGKHTDDQLLFLSLKNDWPVLTVDKKLKERLHDSNCKVVQVVGSKKIELIS
ncbi:MAG: hypothetical protein VX613_05160 [Candidatus Thermoplasmatota archaeon]|nr:hypothetical protein [Candidatus Thermoplasmatota archaeon]